MRVLRDRDRDRNSRLWGTDIVPILCFCKWQVSDFGHGLGHEGSSYPFGLCDPFNDFLSSCDFPVDFKLDLGYAL